MCICDSKYTGPDCNQDINKSPIVVMDGSSVCDTRYEDCQWATTYGAYFPDDVTLECKVEEQEVIERTIA